MTRWISHRTLNTNFIEKKFVNKKLVKDVIVNKLPPILDRETSHEKDEKQNFIVDAVKFYVSFNVKRNFDKVRINIFPSSLLGEKDKNSHRYTD